MTPLSRPRILVVDDEENIRRLLHLAFEDEFEVAVARDGEEASDLALRFKPELIISDIMMPRLDGYGLYRRLRARPETALVPFVFLSAKREVDERVVGLEMGADDYITKPFSPKELKAKVRSLLRRSRDLSGRGTLEGRLGEVDLPEVIQLVEMGRKTGMLVLRDGDRSGQLYFRDGVAVFARTERWEGADAFYTLLGWTAGEFRLEPRPLDLPPNLPGSGQELLMEGIRLLDETRAAMGKLPAPPVRLASRPSGGALPQELAPVLSAFGEGAWADQALERSGIPPYRFYPLALEAFECGLLQVREAGPERLAALQALRRALMEP